MGLRPAFIDAHIQSWEAKLRGGYYPHREKWPSRLFHHSPIENAVEILKGGVLQSRNQATAKAKDVAAAGVIEARSHAHDSVRFYFRPRTATQFHIEGVKRPNELQYGPAAHAPVLIMFVFDARKILSSDGVSFCDRNMQLGSAIPGNSEQYFSNIPFDKVYHEGGWGQDTTIKDHRCAEVLAVSPVRLDEALQWVYCRSEAERIYLLDALGAASRKWKSKILVSDDLKVFEKKHAYVEEVSLSSKGVIFKLNPRTDRTDNALRITVTPIGKRPLRAFDSQIAAVPRDAARWIYELPLADGIYRVKFHIEGQLAFNAHLWVGDALF